MIAFLVFVVCRFLVQLLPLSLSYRVASLVADTLFFLLRAKRRHMIENMRFVLGPDAHPSEVQTTARQSLRNYGKYIVDFLRFPKLTQAEMDNLIRFRDWEHIEEALDGSRGVIFIGMHMGNWDLGAAALAVRNYPVNVIVESFKSPQLNALVQGIREQKGMKVFPIESSLKQVVQALRRNEILGLLIDRPSPESGVAVEFFDKLTKVPAGAATLALKTGARVVTGAVVRLADNSFVGMIDHYIRFQPSGDLKADAELLTQEIMTSLERFVRLYPDQWYMFRRMWVT